MPAIIRCGGRQEENDRLADLQQAEAKAIQARLCADLGEQVHRIGDEEDSSLRMEWITVDQKDEIPCEVLHVNNNTVVPDPLLEDKENRAESAGLVAPLDLPQTCHSRPRSRPASATVRSGSRSKSRPGSASSQRTTKASYAFGTAASRSRSRSRPSSATVRRGRVMQVGEIGSRPQSAVSRNQRSALGGSGQGGASSQWFANKKNGEVDFETKKALGDAQAHRWTDLID